MHASKITGCASLKELVIHRDAGASGIDDFSYLGHPSTYLLEPDELLRIFLDLEAAASGVEGYWVVEVADGLLQRETEMVLDSEVIRSRIHRLIFCGPDAIGCLGGLHLLRQRFDLEPDAFSGRLSSSPLATAELNSQVSIPIFNSLERDVKQIWQIIH